MCYNRDITTKVLPLLSLKLGETVIIKQELISE